VGAVDVEWYSSANFVKKSGSPPWTASRFTVTFGYFASNSFFTWVHHVKPSGVVSNVVLAAYATEIVTFDDAPACDATPVASRRRRHSNDGRAGNQSRYCTSKHYFHLFPLISFH
jgi:hypothetical protein